MITKELVEIPFNRGIDTFKDSFLTPVDTPLVLENGVFRKEGVIQKRYGYTSINTKTITDTALSSLKRLITYNDDLTVLSDTNIYTYSEERDFFVDKGTYSVVNVTNNSLLRNTGVLANADYAEVNGIGVTTWTENDNVYLSVTDTGSNSILLKATQIYDGSTYPGVMPKARVVGNNIVIAWWVSEATDSKLYTCYLTIDNPLVVSSVSTAYTSHVDTPDYQWDCVSYRNGIIAVWNVPDTSNYAQIGYITSTGLDGNATNGFYLTQVLPTDVFGKEAISIATNGDLIFIPYYNSDVASPSRCFIIRYFLPSTGASSPHWYDVDLTGGLKSHLISAIATSPQSIVVVSSEDYTTSPNEVSLRTSILSLDTITGDLTTANYTISGIQNKNQLALASKAWKQGDKVYFLASYQGGATNADSNNLQPTYFVLDTSFNVVAKVLAGVAGGHLHHTPVVNTAPQVTEVETGIYAIPTLQRIRLVAQDGRLFAPVGISKTLVSFANPKVSTAQLGQNQHIAGGFLHIYDGVAAYEAGFHTFPEKPTISKAGTGITGTYSWVGVWEWVDAKGQIHQSAPSAPYTDTVTDDTVTLTFYSLPLTSKSDVKLVLYRTKAGGETYYRVKDAPISSSTIVIADNVSDATIEANQFLYTTGGILENIAPPICNIAARHKNRIFLSGMEDPNIVWYSKESAENEGVAFSDLLTFRVDPSGGRITALASMDDKIVIFKEDSIYFISGDGPNDTGAQNSFIFPQPIPSHVGCINQDSIVSIPTGIMFKSDKGIYLLDRSLNVSYIGKEVEDFKNLTITSAVILPDDSQVRFTTNEGTALVYQIELGMWSTFSNYAALSAVTWKGKYLHLKSNSIIYKETPSAYLDAGAHFSMKIETSWFKNAVQAMMRVWEACLLGRNVSNHVLRIRKYNNYDETKFETSYFKTVEQLDQSYFGEEAYWGTTELFGSPKDKVYQFTMKFAIRNLESFKLVIEDFPASGVSGPAYELSHLLITLGKKDNSVKTQKETV